jgi:hypothetical protein
VTPICGIAALLHADPGRPADPDKVRRMNRTLVHRGPDGDGFHVEGGDQPLDNEDRTIAVIQDGEILNYTKLRAEPKGLEHVFRTRRDTPSTCRCASGSAAPGRWSCSSGGSPVGRWTISWILLQLASRRERVGATAVGPT